MERKPRSRANSASSNKLTKVRKGDAKSSLSRPPSTKEKQTAAPPPGKGTSRSARPQDSEISSRLYQDDDARPVPLQDASYPSFEQDSAAGVHTSPAPLIAASISPLPRSSPHAPPPRLRRMPSNIGRHVADTEARHAALDESTSPQLGHQTASNTAFRELRMARGLAVTPVNEPTTTTGGIELSPKQIHPALRGGTPVDGRRSNTPYSHAPSNTPSTRYTASPAFSQVSSRTSVSSYSPNLVSAAFAPFGVESVDGRRGPPLPPSPKAFKSFAARMAQPGTSPSSPNVGDLSYASQLARAPGSNPQDQQHPRRPSRADVPDLGMARSSKHIVHHTLASPLMESSQNLQGFSNASEIAIASPPPQTHRFFGFRSRSSSRSREDTATPRLSTRLGPGVDSLGGSSLPTNDPAVHGGQIKRAGSAGVIDRLMRRDKTAVPKQSKSQHTLRKGPAAGTGHEGYGRFGFRGRNFSFTNLAKAGRSPSVDSLSSDASSVTFSEDTVPPTVNTHVSRAPTKAAEFSPNTTTSLPNHVTLPDDLPLPPLGSVHRGFDRVPSVDMGDAKVSRQARHDSMQPLSPSLSMEVTGQNTQAPITGSTHDNKRDRRSSRESTRSTDRQSIRPPSRWSFFHRSQAARAMTPAVLDHDDREHRHSTPPVSPPQPSQHNSERSSGSSIAVSDRSQTVAYDERRHSSLLPPPHSSHANTAPKNQRHRTLQDVAHEDLLPHLAESLPDRSSSGAQTSTTSAVDTEGSPRTRERYMRDDWPLVNDNTKVSAAPLRHPLAQSPVPQQDLDQSDQGFISFPLRQNSDLSFTSSSGRTSFQSAATLVASTGPTNAWMGDEQAWNEEVWHEYNDLVDDMSPKASMPASTHPRSTGSSLGRAFQYEDEVRKDAQADAEEEGRPDSKFLPQVYALIDDLEAPPALPDLPKSGSPDRFSKFLHPAATPSTPYSLSDIMAGYGDRRSTDSRVSVPRQPSTFYDVRDSVGSGYSSVYSRMSGPSRPLSKLEVSDRISTVDEVSEPPESPPERLLKRQSQRKTDTELRFGALMTSKWLSFGRVLFSPAHNEIKSGDDVKVLVIDGLGKDWSYYCALTYPNATFYNLDISPADAQEPSRGESMPNYKNVRHGSIGSPFPFPKGFFSAVIFRFPVATTDKAYHSCIFECKRVLRPGGFLEISVLDLDMMNMGTKARRALRSLKMDMHIRDRQVSLRNLGDTMITLVGRRGFENLQRCNVGIPVAGRIPRSGDNSADSSDHSTSTMKPSSSTRMNRPGIDTQAFSDILHAPKSDSPNRSRANDEGITTMIARVGRWWYSTCYSSGEQGSAPTMWDEKGLLRECEKQGAAFKLLLCYAQKPTCQPRRTASV